MLFQIHPVAPASRLYSVAKKSILFTKPHMMNRITCWSCCFVLLACSSSDKGLSHENSKSGDNRLELIIDTDANNELDDQHALAYLFLDEGLFDVLAVTVNATRNGGGIDQHLEEARRIMDLCAVGEEVPLLRGAHASFDDIVPNIHEEEFDGHPAVNFIIEAARKERNGNLILLAIGKLTNVALALAKAPDIRENIRIVWLGTNFPQAGEYNHLNDLAATEYMLTQDVLQEWVVVRYGDSTGTDAVRASPEEIYRIMPGAGPLIQEAVTGRHGGQFGTFGDYSIDLFKHAELYGDPPSRALFDMAAVAILKNPAWATRTEIPVPEPSGTGWNLTSNQNRRVFIWENFNAEAIMNDFFQVMRSSR